MVQSKEHLRQLFENVIDQGDVTTLNTLLSRSTNGSLRLHLLNEPIFGEYTALQKVAVMGKAEMCSVLLEHGAVLEARGKHGQSALHAAVVGGDPDTIVALLLSCADSSATDANGFYPVDYADDDEIRALLLHDMEKKRGKEFIREYIQRDDVKNADDTEELFREVILLGEKNLPDQPNNSGWNVALFNSFDMLAFTSTNQHANPSKGLATPSSSADEGIEEDSEPEPFQRSHFYELF